MNTLFILGNGFDLNLGLNTGYKSFYNYYVKKGNKEDALITTLKDDIKNDIETWADLEVKLGKYTKQLKSLDEFDTIFEDLKKELTNYIKDQEEKLDLKSLDIEKFKEYFLFPERSLPNVEKQELEVFKGTNNTVLNFVTFNYTQSLELILERISTNNLIIIETGVKGSNNYKRHTSRKPEIYHIHGDFNDGILLGVNDSSQISNKQLLENEDFSSSIIKPELNKSLANGNNLVFVDLISKVKLIYVYGCSLGVTDNIWWVEIGKRLLKGDCKLVLFIYEQNVNSITNNKIPRKKREIINRFLSQAKIKNEDKEKVKENIIVAINNSIFEFSSAE